MSNLSHCRYNFSDMPVRVRGDTSHLNFFLGMGRRLKHQSINSFQQKRTAETKFLISLNLIGYHFKCYLHYLPKPCVFIYVLFQSIAPSVHTNAELSFQSLHFNSTKTPAKLHLFSHSKVLHTLWVLKTHSLYFVLLSATGRFG